MDAFTQEAVADRRLSVTRLRAALLPALQRCGAEALCLPLCALFARHLSFDAADPLWPDRDRLVLDPALAPLANALADLAGLPPGTFDAPGSAIGIGTGFALAERLLAARFGRSLVDHRSWVVATAADLATGAVQEAAWLAGAWRLSRLTAIAAVPDGAAPGLAGFAASGWSVRRVDAGAADAVAAAMSASVRAQRPTLIACIYPPDDQDDDGSSAARNECANMWRATGRRGAGVRRAWLKRLARHGSRPDFENALAGRLPHAWYGAFFDQGPLLPPGETRVSTSWTVRRAMVRLAAIVPELARLPNDAAPKQPAGAGAGAALEGASGLCQGLGLVSPGLALHGGVLPVATHGLAEAHSVGAGLRAAASSGLRTLTLMMEPESPCPAGGQRAGLRAMRNLCVFRPADASEALECAELAVRRSTGPTVLLLSATPVALLADRPARTRCAKGGYVLMEAEGTRSVTLIAAGPELHLVIAARVLLEAAGKRVAVVSLPCWSLFARQEAAWQEAVLGYAPRVGVEAGSGLGWDRWIGPRGLFIGAEQMEAVCWSPALRPSTARRIAELVIKHLGPSRPL